MTHPPQEQIVIAELETFPQHIRRLVAETNARLRQFARFRVPEFWHLDGKADTVTLYKAPENSEYQDVRTYGHGDVFRSDALGGVTIPVDELIGPERHDNA